VGVGGSSVILLLAGSQEFKIVHASGAPDRVKSSKTATATSLRKRSQ